MTFGELEHHVHGYIFENFDPTVISAEVTILLNGLSHEDNFVVRRLAKNFRKEIAFESAVKNGDMVSVIRTLSAVLEPMIDWLKHGYSCRSLRQVVPIDNDDRIGSTLGHAFPPAFRPGSPLDDIKAPGGKFSYGTVRAIVREIALKPNLGAEAARKILDHDGRGAKRVSDLRPDYLDMVYELCWSLLANENALAEVDSNSPVEQSEGEVVQLLEWRLRMDRCNSSNHTTPQHVTETLSASSEDNP